MRFGALALTLAFVAIATCAQAGTTWFGPQLSFPLPARDAGDSEPGGSFGVTATEMHRPHVGTGLDLAWHHWPVSPEYKAEQDRFLTNRFYRVIDGSEWAISAFQVTGHVKVLAPIGGRFTSWAKAGLGLYFVDTHITGLPGMRRTFGPGWYGSAGFDVATGAGSAIGLDATLHEVWMDDYNRRAFTAVTVGTHLLFGW